ncbi:MAG TPA: protein translocase subunit SecF [Streptosporangiaceae bacterium]|nr:protein translocase subunit SecF [Streptosporangiaceae bacterium]
MSRVGSIGGRLYRGDVSFDFVGRQKLWYMISGAILVLSLVGLFARGLNFSVDFKGGSVYQFPSTSLSVSQVRGTVTGAGGGADAIVQQVGTGSSTRFQVQTGKLSFAEKTKVQDALASSAHISPNSVSVQFIGPSWGSQISQKAIEALIAFLIVIVVYLSIAFEWKMASAALVALVHDIVITIGVYALAGFQVSPATVIGLLTILGYSLYDTVVVFDKVRENTAGLLGSARSTYSQAANLALNQTLVRSINTSIIALLPVAAILIVGAGLLGAGELKDLALVLFIGMLSGTYSSIFIATPVLADLKERETQYKALAKRVALRASGGRAARRAGAKAGRAPAVAGAGAGGGTVSGDAADAEARVAGSGADVSDDTFDEDGGQEDTPDVPYSEGDGPPEKVTAARGAARPPGPGARPGPRQQPRRASAAKRRPGGKKKRR